jgi:signal transduction histidine kinase
MRLSLAAKITLALVGVLVLAVLSSVVAIVSAHRFENFQETLVDENLSSVRAAEELEIALLEQRGYVSSYILDGGNKSWLEQLNQKYDDFDHWLREARRTSRLNEERGILDELENVQHAYSDKRAEVVELYDGGQESRAIEVLLLEVTALYEQAYDLCEKYIAANQSLVEATSAHVRRQVEQVTFIVTSTLVVTLILALAILWLFFQGVLSPLRRIAADARLASGDNPAEPGGTQRDEMRELGHYVQRLMTNVAETRSDLEQSRTLLAHAEKLAAVGKLAASVAHEIRNPLTAMKMWLYSLRRTIAPGDEALQKLDVVSDEIVRLERVVHHFLEFSRPPPLRITRQNITAILEKTLGLLKYRLQEQRVEVIRSEEPNLPELRGDAEQLEQVFVNLINNAVEAMPSGGEIRISTSTERRGGNTMLAVGIADTGCGMPEDVQERVFEPFFTSKPEGTGLGLCIAASVMARHGGSLVLDSSSSYGTAWTVWIPAVASHPPGK